MKKPARKIAKRTVKKAAAKFASKPQVWMVEGRWAMPDDGPVVPVRSIVEATSRKGAEAGAVEAVEKAIVHLMGGLAHVRGKALGEPVVMHPVADGPLAKRSA